MKPIDFFTALSLSFFLPSAFTSQDFHARNQRCNQATPPHISADTGPNNHSIQLATLF
jgi:hypothetical protein